MPNILLLGGTTEAGLLAHALRAAGMPATYSYAGRTDKPIEQPIPTRVGGFGGIEGLEAYLTNHKITHVIDATHPFAARMSGNAVAACAALSLPLIVVERAPWVPVPGDRWIVVRDIEAAVDALPEAPARVFLAIGRQNLGLFAAKPQHHYVLRLVDQPDVLPLPNASVLIARGPFGVAGDTALLHSHRISHIVAKNAGGTGASAKLAAARALNLPVILIARPVLPARHCVGTVDEVMQWLHADLGVKT
jgi:precorrin-6A/cobalt-precorrin-6A reductase